MLRQSILQIVNLFSDEVEYFTFRFLVGKIEKQNKNKTKLLLKK